MERMEIGTKETKDFFVKAFEEKTLIPILGSGFSRGMQARGTNTVPSGNDLKDDMIDMIIKHRSEFSKDALRNKDFSWLAKRFFECETKKVEDYFYQNFTGVRFVGENKKKFLNEIDWPYIYTLNIDTAIENSDKNWDVFYPNEKFRDDCVLGTKKLYKIHGDVNLYLKTKDVDKLILSETQYLKSLHTNSLFHDKLSADCAGHNLLYIGCSLDDEIDIKYSVISDKERNISIASARRIYVTFDCIDNDPIKLEDLNDFNITHYIKLDTVSDYEMFYEFVYECYCESLNNIAKSYDCYNVKGICVLENNRELNLDFLLNLTGEKKLCKPYYYFSKSNFSIDSLMTEKINVFIGRRFSGKTLFSYGILDSYRDRKKYIISSNDTISDYNLEKMLKDEHALIIADANSISETQFSFICKEFDKNQKNILCIFVNTFDEIANSISYYADAINLSNLKFDGRLTDEEVKQLNKKLGDLGIGIFDKGQTILDNTLRIGNEFEKDKLSNYIISSEKELTLLIWLAVNKKIYLEQLLTLSLYNDYNAIVKKFSPILEIERNYKGGQYDHSPLKIICNAPIALLQIINNYAYPTETKMGKERRNAHFKKICKAIYTILFKYDSIDKDTVKKFLLFDTLNDIFSQQYSKENIEKLNKNDSFQKPRTHGAAALIQAIYEDPEIQKLKSSEPNYWLQRAKSLYILNSGKNGRIDRLEEGIEWAKKTIADSKILIKNGQHRYIRTLSNATIQIAMLYGKMAFRKDYKDIRTNSLAIQYYYAGFSDTNNLPAAKSIMDRGRGTKDFTNLLNKIKLDRNVIFTEDIEKAEYLCNISDYSGGIVYRL